MKRTQERPAMFLQDTAVGDLTRGGQLILHFLRMLGQVLKKFLGAMITAYIGVGLLLGYWWTDEYERYLGWKSLGAYVSVDVFKNGEVVTDIRLRDGRVVKAKQGQVRASPALQDNVDRILRSVVLGITTSVLVITSLFLIVVGWIWRAGHRQRLDYVLRGNQIVEGDILAKHLKASKRASALSIAGVPLVKDTETTHILVTGSPGTGKSTILHSLLQQIRANGDRCICYSPSGDFISWFYREGKDHLLNPFDDRCPSWNLWAECTEPYHFEMLAAAIIPEPLKDPFWNISARAVLSALAQKMGRRGERSLTIFIQRLLQADLSTLHNYLRGTDAAALLDERAEKTAAGVRMTAGTYARSFGYLRRKDTEFHFREWVQNDRGDDWVFLNARPDQIAAVRPVLSAWLEVFTNALLSLPPSRTRRIWLVIDELPSLNKIPSLSQFLAQARKYGGCGVIGFQQIAQLREIYGDDGAEALSGLCATWTCLRQNDPDTAKWTAQSFGETEVMEAQQGLSYGANDMRDGVSLQQNRRSRPLILPTEIANLADLEGYIRLPGDAPIGHFKMKWSSKKTIAEEFVHAQGAPIVDPIPDDDGRAVEQGMTMNLFVPEGSSESPDSESDADDRTVVETADGSR